MRKSISGVFTNKVVSRREAGDKGQTKRPAGVIRRAGKIVQADDFIADTAHRGRVCG